MRKFLLPAGLTLANVALQISGYQNPKLAGFLIVAALYSWLWWGLSHKQVIEWCRRRRPVSLIAAVSVGVVLGGGLGFAWWYWKIKPVLPPQSEPAQSDAGPLLQIGSDMGNWLPIHVPARSEVRILSLLDDSKVSMTNFKNEEDKEYLWPTKEPIEPPELITVYRLSNHDQVMVFNILVNLTVQFLAPGTGVKVDKTLAQGWEIDSLAPGTSSPLYIVNQSRAGVMVPFPKTAEVEVQGKVGRVRTQLLLRGPLSSIPAEGINTLALPIEPSQRHSWINGKLVAK